MEYLENAIEIMKERAELDKIRDRKRITKKAISEAAGVSGCIVTRYFQGANHSKNVDRVVRQMLGVA